MATPPPPPPSQGGSPHLRRDLAESFGADADAAGGSFTMRYATVATAAVKVGAPTGR